jgi:hypothetical protein
MVEAPMIFVAYSKACYRNRNDVWGGREVRRIPPSDRRGEWAASMQYRYRRHAAKAAARFLHISAAMPKIVVILGTLQLHEKGKEAESSLGAR